MEVCDVDSHGLFAHSALVSVPGTLIMIREGNDGGTNSYNNTGEELVTNGYIVLS